MEELEEECMTLSVALLMCRSCSFKSKADETGQDFDVVFEL
jgi:hypothetical protein